MTVFRKQIHLSTVDCYGHEKVWVYKFLINFVKGGISKILFSLLVEGTKYFLHILSLSYGHLACRKCIKNKMLLLHNRAESIIGIFYKKCSVKLQYETKNLLNVSSDHKCSNNFS